MTNFVFSRRAIQKMLDELTQVLSPQQRTALIQRLNEAGAQRIPAMWEAVFLHGLSKAVPLKHEVPLPDGRAPDFTFDVDGIAVVGDVTTVSDVGVDEANPVHLLDDEIVRLARKYQLPPQCFGHQVRPKESSKMHSRIVLDLPTKSEFARYARTFIEPFFSELSRDRMTPRARSFVKVGHNFSISYIPDQTLRAGGYPVYDLAWSLTKNPLFSALRQKADQLRNAPKEALRLIVACDGGTAILRAGMPGYSSGAFTAKQIAVDFLRQHSSLDFVAIISVRSTNSRPQKFSVLGELVARPPGQRHARLSDHAFAKVGSVIKQVVERMPVPQQTSFNAVTRALRAGVGPDMVGGYEMKGRNLRLSARALQRLLAGEISQADFDQAHNWGSGGNMQNPFLRALLRGEMIQSVKIENGGEDDDDWVEFVFAWDPASGPFR